MEAIVGEIETEEEAEQRDEEALRVHTRRSLQRGVSGLAEISLRQVSALYKLPEDMAIGTLGTTFLLASQMQKVVANYAAVFTPPPPAIAPKDDPSLATAGPTKVVWVFEDPPAPAAGAQMEEPLMQRDGDLPDEVAPAVVGNPHDTPLPVQSMMDALDEMYSAGDDEGDEDEAP